MAAGHNLRPHPAAEIATEHREVQGHRLPDRQTVRNRAGTLVYPFETYRLNPPLELRLFDLDSAMPDERDPATESPPSEPSGSPAPPGPVPRR